MSRTETRRDELPFGGEVLCACLALVLVSRFLGFGLVGLDPSALVQAKVDRGEYKQQRTTIAPARDLSESSP